MAFAGHPTVGASYVLIDEGMVPPATDRFMVDELVGSVAIRVESTAEGPLIWLKTPPIEDGPLVDRTICAAALGLTSEDLAGPQPQLLSAGNPTLFIPLKTKEVVDSAWLEMAGLRMLLGNDSGPACVFVFAATLEGAYSRMFAPEYGIAEDPATGSSTRPLAAYMMRHKMISKTRFISEQGTKMGRRSILHVDIRGDEIDVGGYVTPLVRAVMTLP